MTFQCPRCGTCVQDGLQRVHETQCRASAMAPNLGHHAYSSHQPHTYTTQMYHHPPPTSQPVIPHAAYQQVVVAPPIAPGFRNGPSDSDPWRRKLDKLRDDLIRKIDKSSELTTEDRRICSEYVNNVKVYQNLVVYTYAHLKRCTTDRRLLDELKRKITEWKGWHADDLRVLRKHRIIRDDLKKLLNQSRTLCRVHVSVEVAQDHIVPNDDGVALRSLLVPCGRDHENKFYGLRDDQAQVMVDLLEEVLRDPSIDDATHARLLKYIIRLSRKSGRLPRQLLLDVEPHQMDAVGHGGSATIYRASYKNKIVAVKRSHLPRVAQCRKDFVSEAVIWSHLKHENIVPFNGVIEKDYSLWLVSKWMDNGNVRIYLNGPGRRASCDLRHLAEGAAKGLRYLHALHPPIVHGDLKGYNVLVDNRGNACLVDFGISHSDDSRQILDSSKVGRREAALNWIAPELIFGNAESMRMTLETDMYAFGCVLYEIYTGCTPFDKENVIQCLREGKRPSLRGLEEPIRRIIEGCWQEDPRQRTKAPAVVEALRKMKRIFPPMGL